METVFDKKNPTKDNTHTKMKTVLEQQSIIMMDS